MSYNFIHITGQNNRMNTSDLQSSQRWRCHVGLLAYDATWTWMYTSIFWRNLPSSHTGLKIEKGSMFPRTVCICREVHLALKPRRPTSKRSEPLPSSNKTLQFRRDNKATHSWLSAKIGWQSLKYSMPYHHSKEVTGHWGFIVSYLNTLDSCTIQHGSHGTPCCDELVSFWHGYNNSNTPILWFSLQEVLLSELNYKRLYFGWFATEKIDII